MSLVPTVAAVAGLGPISQATRADAIAARSSTLNICGSACHRWGQSNYRLRWGYEYLEDSVAQESGLWQVSATEACSMQVLDLASAFDNMSVSYFRTLSYDATCGGSYGIVVFAVGASIGAATQTAYPGSTYNSGSIPANARSIGCQQKQGWGFDWYACVTHLVGNGTGDPGAQAAVAMFVVGPKPRRIVSGDFNLNASVPYWNSNDEGDQTFFDTGVMDSVFDANITVKYDYNFLPRSWMPLRLGATSCGTFAATVNTAQYTDHCYVNGTFAG